MEGINEFEEGSVIGSYRIVRPLGQGAAGTVYEVDDVRTGKRLALKVFTPRKGNSPLWRLNFLLKRCQVYLKTAYLLML